MTEQSRLTPEQVKQVRIEGDPEGVVREKIVNGPCETYRNPHPDTIDDSEHTLRKPPVTILDSSVHPQQLSTEQIKRLEAAAPVEHVGEVHWTPTIADLPQEIQDDPYIDHAKLLRPSVFSEPSVAAEADELVAGDDVQNPTGERSRDYGHPLDNFGRIADIGHALLPQEAQEALEAIGYRLDAEFVGRFMIGVKIARDVNKVKRDNYVDACGYAKTLDMIRTERARRSQR